MLLRLVEVVDKSQRTRTTKAKDLMDRAIAEYEQTGHKQRLFAHFE